MASDIQLMILKCLEDPTDMIQRGVTADKLEEVGKSNLSHYLRTTEPKPVLKEEQGLFVWLHERPWAVDCQSLPDNLYATGMVRTNFGYRSKKEALLALILAIYCLSES